MIVCLDSGNSRVKWGVHDGLRWLAQGVVAHEDIENLRQLPGEFPSPEKVMLSNVAGTEAGLQIRKQLAPWRNLFVEVTAEAACCGVFSRYENPRSLGVDRWCALIGARALTSSAVLVVMAGTATTIDSMDKNGVFTGGFILPGIDLMLRSLARETAGLPHASGVYSSSPRCTGDAIVSGAIEAQVGAIERAFSRLDDENAVCIISGGNAETIREHLVFPVMLAHNLPLEGLRQLSLAS